MRPLGKSLIGALLVALVVVIGPAPHAGASGVVTAAGSRDLPRREMNDEVFTNAKGWLIFKGDVEPGWANRKIRLYKRECKACAWKLVRWIPTDDEGRWRTRIYAPRTGYWYWKGVVPKRGDYGRSVTRIYRTYVV